ncbi:unnamed protein product [Timema podura]|uniref:Uncharacterized protein n=1 Tax=Timema podura TaxID=61482 RepID=A0ABN7PMW0_TIMPD|nr:unnamed protein product [Timema podura]
MPLETYPSTSSITKTSLKTLEGARTSINNPTRPTTMAVFLARADAIVMSRGAYGMYINIEHEDKEGQAITRTVMK